MLDKDIKEKDIVYWNGIQGVVFDIQGRKDGNIYCVALNENKRYFKSITFGGEECLSRWVRCKAESLKSHAEQWGYDWRL
jgi:hypothetical protein